MLRNFSGDEIGNLITFATTLKFRAYFEDRRCGSGVLMGGGGGGVRGGAIPPQSKFCSF